ncbi:6-phosphogluconolactonase [Phycisphaerales bacterium AB-hyl4]|uniref:6-phosphogluconolactonase n=1 Tax=Natronomicrosphaera hydrolytica TaxID=3242702 RepID=A0ABV4U712_9BACT
MAEPKLTGAVHVTEDVETLYDDLGKALMGAAQRAVDERGVFHLALSGGSTPERFYMHLVMEPPYRTIPWDKTHIWIVDERCVPFDDDKSNWKMIQETLADHVPMRRRNKHPMPVMDAEPAKAYEHELCEVFACKPENPRLDFVLLGMGDDCHTASLFPHSSALRVNDCMICANEGKHVVPPPRVTMTYALLNAARELAVMVTGEKKADAIKRIEAACEQGGGDPREMPIVGIDPIDGELTWYMDKAAAGG